MVTNTTFRAAPWADVLYAMDRAWWRMHIDEVCGVFGGRLMSSLDGCCGADRFANDYRNSGVAAIALAASEGADRIVLLGYDCQRTNGQAHWHGDHPPGLGNAGSLNEWPAQFNALAAALVDVDIVNCTRETALQCWPRAELEDCL